MLLSPEVKCQPVHFPTPAELSAAELQTIRQQLPGLTGQLQRVSRNYLGPDADVGTAELVRLNAHLRQIADIQGPVLASELEGTEPVLVTLAPDIAAACIVSLLGAPVGGREHSTTLTDVDLAILKPYLQAIAAGFGRTILPSSRRHHQFLPAPQARQLLAQPGRFAVRYPLHLDSVTGTMVIVAPVAAWRRSQSGTHQAGTPSLTLHQLGQASVHVEAVITGASLSLAEISTLEPGDVIPLPQGQQTVVQLRAGHCPVAIGRPGAQAQHFAVRLSDVGISKEA